MVTPPCWRLRVTRWCVAFFTLCCAYQLYAVTIVPLIEPVVVHRRNSGDTGILPGRQADPELMPLFPEDAWERKRPMVLKTQWGKLLFQKYKTSPDGRLELIPCTIVVYAPAHNGDGSAKRRPIILQAPNKAVLSFSGPLNLLRAEFSKLQGALLEGEVKIFSSESREGANDALSIVTRNIQILPRQIWTPHDVFFRYGDSHGSGRDLSIKLASAQGEGSPQSKDSLVNNVESLELAHIDKLVLHVPGQGLLGQTSPPPPTRNDTGVATGTGARMKWK